MQRAVGGVGVKILIVNKAEEVYIKICGVVVGTATVVEKTKLSSCSMRRRATQTWLKLTGSII